LQENEDVVEKIKCIVCKMYVYKKNSRKDMGLAVDSGFTQSEHIIALLR